MSETKTYTGSCACGAVAFSATGPPLFRTLCHCTICARYGGTPGAALVGFKEGGLVVTKGEALLKGHNSSESMTRFFCTECGASVYNQSLIPDMAFRDAPLGNFARDAEERIIDLDDLSPTSHGFFKKGLGISDHLGDSRPKWKTYGGFGEQWTAEELGEA